MFQLCVFDRVFGLRSLLNVVADEPLMSVHGKNHRKCRYRRSDLASYIIQVYNPYNHSSEIRCSIQLSAKVDSVVVGIQYGVASVSKNGSWCGGDVV